MILLSRTMQISKALPVKEDFYCVKEAGIQYRSKSTLTTNSSFHVSKSSISAFCCKTFINATSLQLVQPFVRGLDTLFYDRHSLDEVDVFRDAPFRTAKSGLNSSIL